MTNTLILCPGRPYTVAASSTELMELSLFTVYPFHSEQKLNLFAVHVQLHPTNYYV